MAWQMIKQPNGKYAIWSGIQDNFLYLNITAKQYVEILVRQYRDEITEEITKKAKMLDKGKKAYYQFTITWEEALKKIGQMHGNDSKEKAKALGEEKNKSRQKYQP